MNTMEIGYEAMRIPTMDMREAEANIMPPMPEDQKSGLLDRFSGVAMVGMSVVALAGANELAPGGTSEADASTPGNVTHDTTVKIAGDEIPAHVFSRSRVKIWVNHRTVSKARVNKARRAGRCERVSAKKAIKMGIRTQGHNGSGAGFALENRKSTLCDLDGDGDFDVRADCGNKVRQGKPMPKKAKEVLWLNTGKKAKIKVTDRVELAELAVCRTENTFASASVTGKGEVSAWVRIEDAIKHRGKGIKKVIRKVRIGAGVEAKLDLIGNARAECREQGGVIVPPPEQQGKDGSVGPGAGTPGQAGGPGAGGEPGNPTTGEVCQDTNDPNTGDKNANTKGDIVSGPSDQFGYCTQ